LDFELFELFAVAVCSLLPCRYPSHELVSAGKEGKHGTGAFQRNQIIAILKEAEVGAKSRRSVDGTGSRTRLSTSDTTFYIYGWLPRGKKVVGFPSRFRRHLPLRLSVLIEICLSGGRRQCRLLYHCGRSGLSRMSPDAPSRNGPR